MPNARILELVDSFLNNIPENETDFIAALNSFRDDVLTMADGTDQEMWGQLGDIIETYIDADELKTPGHMTGWRRKVLTDLNPSLDLVLKKPKKPKKKDKDPKPPSRE